MKLLIGFRFAPHSATPQLAVRHAAEVVERDGDWFESFASDCWLARGRGAQIQFGHNSTVIGSVDVVAAGRDGWWHGDGTINTDDLADDAVVRERIRVGAPISLGFDPIHHDDDLHLRIRRHDLTELRHIAVLRKGEMPAYAGAKITSVREIAARSRRPNLKRVLTAQEANAEIWRRVRSGMDFADAYDDDLISRAPAKGSWWLPIPQDCLSAA